MSKKRTYQEMQEPSIAVEFRDNGVANNDNDADTFGVVGDLLGVMQLGNQGSMPLSRIQGEEFLTEEQEDTLYRIECLTPEQMEEIERNIMKLITEAESETEGPSSVTSAYNTPPESPRR